MRGRIRTLAKYALALIPVLVVILLLEAAYRFAMFDPYGPELRAYNSVEDLATKIPARTVLVMGDSMTAGARSYPALMRGAIPDLRVINAGIPGSGILQANIVAAKRFREFDPDVFLYQITVGNDLLNLRYPIHWRKVSFARNVYWSVVHRLRLIEYLNYRSGQLAFSIRHREFLRDRAAGGPPEPRSCGYDPDEFDPLEYTKRIRIYFQADPGYLEDQVLVRASRERDFERLLDGLQRLLGHCDPESCRSFLLLVPAPPQVDPAYLDRFRRIGARFGDPAQLQQTEYPFLRRLREALAGSGQGHVTLLNPIDALREAEQRGNPVFFLHDDHLNDCGQDVLAKVVSAAVAGGGIEP